MDPSYNSGGNNTPGVKPGVISSGGNNTPGVKPGVIASGPESEELQPQQPLQPQQSLQSQQSLPSRRRLGFRSRNNVGRQPMQLSRASGGPKRSLIIGGIAVIAILIVVLVVAMVMGGNNNRGTSSGTTTFNDLINYVTSGVKSNASVTDEYDVSKDYYFLNGWSDENEKNEVYAETQILLNNFVKNYKDGDNEILNNLVKTTKEQFDFIYAIGMKGRITSTSIVMDAIKNGNEIAKQNAMSYYDLSNLSNNIYASDFVVVLGEWVDALLSQVNLYRANGCLGEYFINTECMRSKNDEELNKNADNISSSITNLYQNVIGYYAEADDFIENIYNINAIFNGKSVMGGENE